MKNVDYKIDNCSWKKKCDLTFNALEKTAEDNVRYCDKCKNNVYLCQTSEELKFHIESNHCVAFKQCIDKDSGTEELMGYLDIPSFLRKE